jgi:hypothetical protein
MQDPRKLGRHKLLFWNCGEVPSPRVLALVAPAVAQFVRDGGYLFTTDWGVGALLGHAFPNRLTTRGQRQPLPEMVIDIAPAAEASGHPLLEGVFRPRVQARWWIEQASFDLRVVDGAEVTVLVESATLAEVPGRSPAVAATFVHGRGRVLHVLGHYYQQQGNLQGTIASHRLALNLMLLRLAKDK